MAESSSSDSDSDLEWTPQQLPPSRRAYAPQVDAGSLTAAVQDLETFLKPRNESARIRIARLLYNLRVHIEAQGITTGKSALLISYLRQRYKPSTCIVYASLMQKEDPRLRTDPEFQQAFHRLKQLKAEYDADHPGQGSVPATPSQVRRLIGDLTTPVQRMIFQLWVTAARHRESLPRVNSDGSRNERVWVYRCHPHTEPTGVGLDRRTIPGIWVVELHLHTHKAATTGRSPYSKWVKTHRPDLFLPHLVNYWASLDYVKRCCPNLTVHSFRKGAIQYLHNAGFSPRQTCLLTGHSDLSSIPGMRPYTDTKPYHENALRVLQMTDILQRVVIC